MKQIFKTIFALAALVFLFSFDVSAVRILDYETGEFIEGDRSDPQFAPIFTHTKTGNVRIDEFYFRYAFIEDSPWYEGCIRWNLPGFLHGFEEGKPETPMSGYSVPLVPKYYKRAVIIMLESEYKDFNFELQPALPMCLDCEPQRFVDIDPYDGFYPEEQIFDNGTEIYRGQSYQYVGVRPVSYDYNNHIVRAYTHLKYKLEYTTEESGVNEITADVDEDGVEFYNLQGLRVFNPQRGNLYIVRQRDIVRKIIY